MFSLGSTTYVEVNGHAYRRRASHPATSDESAGIGDDAGDGGGGGGEWTREQRASTAPLTSLEVAIARRDGELAGLELIAVHRDAHRAAGLAPLGARLLEDASSPSASA